MAKYLVDPRGFALQDPRLEVQGRKYGLMPSYRMLTPEQINALADYVLAMP